MKIRPRLIVETDVFTRTLEVILDPDCSAERYEAFADFFSHDVPDFTGWTQSICKRSPHIAPAQVIFVDSVEDLHRELPTADAVVVESLPIGQAELAMAPRLKAVQKYGFVTRNIDVAACKARGVEVMTVRRRANIACAEQALMLMLALAKRLPEVNKMTSMKRLEDAGFKPRPFDRRHTPSSNWARISGIEMLSGATLGILGFGEIGQEIALRAKVFGMKIIYSQRTRADAQVEKDLQAEYRDLDALLAESDWLVPQLPATPSTHNILDAACFAKLKKGARLVNVSRAQVMERDAVIAALRDGTLGGFALDTLWKEPGSDDDELLSFPNVILTPHLAGSPRFNATADFEEMVANLDHALRH
jgi:phosphoglycerate dehydrogenase-like enzyme